MSGDIGRRVTQRPGYMGYIPSPLVKSPDTVTQVNTKLPLAARLSNSVGSPRNTNSSMKSAPDSFQDSGASNLDIPPPAPTLHPSKCSYFQKKGLITSTYGMSSGAYHGECARVAPSMVMGNSHGTVNGCSGNGMNTTRLSATTTKNDLSGGYISVSQPKNNFMSVVHAHELQIMNGKNEDEESFKNQPPTRSSARKTLPSIRTGEIREIVREQRPEFLYSLPNKVTKCDVGAGRVGASICKDIKMFNSGLSTTYEGEIGIGRTRKLVNEKPYPGYQGHVPQCETNQMKLKNDIPHINNKANILAGAPCRAMTGYGGHIPQSIHNDRGSNGLKPALCDTTSGTVSGRVALDEFAERKMNTVVGAKCSAVRKFFSAGPYSDHTISDQFYMRYRPYGGFMKAGPQSTASWIGEKELRTSVLQ